MKNVKAVAFGFYSTGEVVPKCDRLKNVLQIQSNVLKSVEMAHFFRLKNVELRIFSC